MFDPVTRRKNVFLVCISFASYEWIPYAAGCIISYARKNKFVDDNYNFMEPEYRSKSLEFEDFHDRLFRADVLGLTNWVWNQNYNDRIAKLYKEYRPDGVVVYGGVNVPEEKDVGIEYAKERPYVDIFFAGPGEDNFTNFLANYPEQGIEGHHGSFTHSSYQAVVNRMEYKKVDIPFPYLEGIFDNIIKNSRGELSALFETNRGCPYNCAFCDWGGMTRSKLQRANIDKVKDTISFIMGHKKINKIEIADANFGIVPVDIEYMQHLIDENDKRDSNIYLTMGGFAKNGSPYTEKIMQMMHSSFDAYHGRKYIKLSFQSHDKDVLEAVNRGNLNNDKLIPMMKRFQEQGVEVDAEMIIGMPGDNSEKWLQTIQKNMDLRINHQKSFTLYVVPNTPMASKEYRDKFKMKTKKVLVPYDLDHTNSQFYHDSRKTGPVYTKCDFTDQSEYQTIEFMYECHSFDSQELMKIYDIWFWFNTLYNAKVARDWMLADPRSAKEQFNDFLDRIESGKMPFFKEQLEEYRDAVWNIIAKPEPVTKVTNLFHVNFMVKFVFRGNEVINIYDNQEIALKELQQVYPSLNFNHFGKVENKLRLYYVAAEVTQ